MLPQSVLDAIASWEQLHVVESDGIQYRELDAFAYEYITVVTETACKGLGYLNCMYLVGAGTVCFGILLFGKFMDVLEERRKRKAAATLPNSPESI